MFQEKEADHNVHIPLIKTITEHALDNGFDVILEGILSARRYGALIKELLNKYPQHYVYYFDIPFVETLKRHATKSNASEFGEKEMREWYKPKDFLGHVREEIIDESYTLDDAIKFIKMDAGL